jgi:hypothetical protein
VHNVFNTVSPLQAIPSIHSSVQFSFAWSLPASYISYLRQIEQNHGDPPNASSSSQLLRRSVAPHLVENPPAKLDAKGAQVHHRIQTISWKHVEK